MQSSVDFQILSVFVHNGFTEWILCRAGKIPEAACADGAHGRDRLIFFRPRTEFVVAGRVFVG